MAASRSACGRGDCFREYMAMCGIFALFSRRNPVQLETIQRATSRLHHRGPDGQRPWMTGDQPIASADQRTHIIANGEFYGYEEIRRELQEAGHSLRTRSDSEIALHLYRDLGPQCLHRLRGEFAFVIWDESERVMFAAR